MVEINPNILIITININGLNLSVKRHRLSNWGKNPDISYKHNSHRLKANAWKKINQVYTD